VATTDILATAAIQHLWPSRLDGLVLHGLRSFAGSAVASEISQVGVRPTARAECLRALAGLDLRPSLQRYNGPALIINGAGDRPVITRQQQLAQFMPRARVVTVASAGHVVNRDAPEAFTDAVAQFATHLTPAS
jgi:pimeloyl-ACP methyl ester carboxylesterase